MPGQQRRGDGAAPPAMLKERSARREKTEEGESAGPPTTLPPKVGEHYLAAVLRPCLPSPSSGFSDHARRQGDRGVREGRMSQIRAADTSISRSSSSGEAHRRRWSSGRRRGGEGRGPWWSNRQPGSSPSTLLHGGATAGPR
jgi:hypothetical protein